MAHSATYAPVSKEVVLVDGAGGFLGSHVVKKLRDQGWRVRATDLPSSHLELARAAGAEVVPCDLLDVERVKELLAGVSSAVHIAGVFDYSLPLDVLRKANVETTRNICEACIQTGIGKLIHISSITVYGTPQTVPVGENHPLLPDTNYGLTKKEAEDVVMAYHRRHNLPVVILRPAGMYGPRSRYGQAGFFAYLALLRLKGVRILPIIKGGPRMHHVHVEDVAQAVLLMLKSSPGHGEAYNVGDDTPLSQGDLLAFAARQMGITVPFRIPYATRLCWPFFLLALGLPASSFQRLNARCGKRWREIADELHLEPVLMPRIDRDYLMYMKGDFVLDTSKLQAIGFRLTYPDTIAGMTQTLKWYRDHRWLPPEAI